jgi:subtilase family serine protease
MLEVRTTSRRLFRKDSSPRRNQPGVEELETRTLLSTTVIPASLLNLEAHPTISSVEAVATPTSVTNPAKAPFTPQVIRSAYGVNVIQFPNGSSGYVTGNGSGETIAIADAFYDPDISSDLVAFDAEFGLPNPPSFTVLNENGGTNLSGIPLSPSTSDWTLEQSLDVEWSHSIAPAANIVLFEANSNNNIDLDISDQTAANPATYAALGIPAAGVVSNSFGSTEGTNPTLDETQADEEFEDSNFYGPISAAGTVTMVASAGDNGVQNYPSVSPYVLSVGGTALTVKVSPFGDSYSSETAWTTSRSGEGTGGGTSLFEPEPTYQTNYGINDTDGFRATPDVSEDASPSTGVYVLDTVEGGYFQVGGTSLSAPLWAGILAITNQGRALQGEGVLANAQEAVYDVPASDFHDITSGHNLVATAGPGYDEVTGIGTPIANKLVYDLVDATTGPVEFAAAAPASVGSSPSSVTDTDDIGHGGPISAEAPVESANTSLAIATVADAGQATRALSTNTVTVSLASGSTLVRTDTSEVTALPGHSTTVLEGFRSNTDTELAAVDTAVPTDTSLPAASDDLPTPAATAAVDFAGGVVPATQAGMASDAVFADFGSVPAMDNPVSAMPVMLTGNETHSIDLAMMAGLALALGGAWSTTARAEENRKYPALRS